MYAFSRTVFIIVTFLRLVLNYCEMHQSGRKRFVNDSTSYLKDFNFQVHFTILSTPMFIFFKGKGCKQQRREMPITFIKPDKRAVRRMLYITAVKV